MAKDKLMSFLSSTSLSPMASDHTLLNGTGMSSSIAGLNPLTSGHNVNSYSTGNVSLLTNGHLSGGLANGFMGGSDTNTTNGYHHHQQHQPPPDYYSGPQGATAAQAMHALPTSFNLDLSLANAGLSNLSFSSSGGAVANGTAVGELLSASVVTSAASHTLMSDSGD